MKLYYLIWELAEVATKKGRAPWQCWCGERRDDEHSMRSHLEDAHKMTNITLESIEN